MMSCKEESILVKGLSLLLTLGIRDLGSLKARTAIAFPIISYAMEKRMSKTPERFGKGAPEGVAGPESANNSGAVGAMVVLLTLGLPYNVVTAVMLSAMIAHGIFLSPLLMARSPDFFWTVVASMYIGNFMLLILARLG